MLAAGLLAVQWAAAPTLPPEMPKPPHGKPSAEHLEKLRDKLKELNPDVDTLPVRYPLLTNRFSAATSACHCRHCCCCCCCCCWCLSVPMSTDRSHSVAGAAGAAGAEPCQT